MIVHHLCTITLMLAAGASSAARADEILLGRIPISGVEVRGVTECEVHYTMAGRLSTRPIDRVILHLDAVPALEKAETAAAEGRIEDAMKQLDEAMKQAAEPWHKTWVHYRRTRLLDAAGRYTPACESWATLLLTSVDACWLDAIPACPPDRPDAATRDAALGQLRKALDQAAPDTVAAEMLDATIRAVSDLETSERYETGPAAASEKNPTEEPALPAAEPRPEPARSPGDTADEIDDLIEAGRMREARERIERRVADTKSYPLDRLLYQYGQVLAGANPRDAAVRFMQCAILFAGSSYAPPSLFEAARLYAGPLDDVAVARRLLGRRAAADPDQHAALRERIDAALAELNSRR